MSERDNIELIKKGYATKRGNMQSLLELFADDLESQHPMPQSIWPWAGARKGRGHSPVDAEIRGIDEARQRIAELETKSESSETRMQPRRSTRRQSSVPSG
jgi:ketosteroid isomerase-like protein